MNELMYAVILVKLHRTVIKISLISRRLEGLGYSLPVLATCQSTVESGYKTAEHLHPALQAAMGDAVLQSAKSDHRL